MNNSLTKFHLRFDNLKKGLLVFNRRCKEFEQNRDSEAYQMALVHAFEIVVELSWKTLKVYLEENGFKEIQNGRQAIRQAYQDGIISSAETWMKALELRNLSSHTYQIEILSAITNFISDEFSPLLLELESKLSEQIL
jgi:nucleotidyltransferase substrate binding protein (TIGR01987 family)